MVLLDLIASGRLVAIELVYLELRKHAVIEWKIVQGAFRVAEHHHFWGRWCSQTVDRNRSARRFYTI